MAVEPAFQVVGATITTADDGQLMAYAGTSAPLASQNVWGFGPRAFHVLFSNARWRSLTHSMDFGPDTSQRLVDQKWQNSPRALIVTHADLRQQI